MRLPSIRTIRRAVAEEQRYLRRTYHPQDLISPGEEYPGTDVRLQVYPDGQWSLHTGPSDYDQDHRGFWGAAWIPQGVGSCEDIARDLLDQVRDHMAQNEAQED